MAALVGGTCFEATIEELRGTYLADFDHARIHAELNAEERARYERCMRAFRDARRVISLGQRDLPWPTLVARLRQLPGGEGALHAFRVAERLLSYPSAKAAILGRVLATSAGRRVLCFTADNRAAYAVAREHLLWPITCDIKKQEREEALALFREGKLRGLVSSRVLNEGYDVPDADVAIIVSAKLGLREHVQRIGRVLRPSPGKRAQVFELVCRGTIEERRAKSRELPRERRRRRGACLV